MIRAIILKYVKYLENKVDQELEWHEREPRSLESAKGHVGPYGNGEGIGEKSMEEHSIFCKY